MKIAIVISDITKKGGAENIFINLANLFFEQLGHDISIISYYNKNSCSISKIDERVKSVFLNIFKYSKGQSFFKKMQHRQYSKILLRNYLNEGNFDVVVGVGAAVTVHLAEISKKLKAKVIGTERTPYDEHSLKVKLKRRVLYKNLAYLQVLTREDEKRFKRFVKNVKVIPNLMQKFSNESSSLENKIVMGLGRLTEQKGFSYLVDAFEIVIDKHPDWKLKIVGEGEQRGLLEKKIRERGLGRNILLQGYLAPNLVSKEFLSSSIFVLSSLYEGFGLVLLEAFKFGLPIVSYNCKSGPSEIIDEGKNGYLVKPKSIQGLADKINVLIENEELRKKFGANGLNRVKDFSVGEILPLWEELFVRVLREN